MSDMPQTKHAKPKDHLWVLAVIAAAVLAEVWASWVGIGAMSGFPRIDRIPTDWVLAVAVEAYWGYALYAWLAAAPGPRSRAMAMWSCAVVFVLSLISQVSYHELTAPAGATTGRRFVIGFASALPVIILALIAVLVHLRHLDRAEAVQAEEAARKAERIAAAEAAAADERTTLRAELEAERAALQPLRADLETARGELGRVTAKAEAAEARAEKLKAATARKRGTATGRKRAPATARKSEAATGPATGPETDSDIAREALVLKYLAEGHSASEAGRMAGLTDSRGRQIARKLATAAPKGQDEAEGS